MFSALCRASGLRKENLLLHWRITSSTCPLWCEKARLCFLCSGSTVRLLWVLTTVCPLPSHSCVMVCGAGSSWGPLCSLCGLRRWRCHCWWGSSKGVWAVFRFLILNPIRVRLIVLLNWKSKGLCKAFQSPKRRPGISPAKALLNAHNPYRFGWAMYAKTSRSSDFIPLFKNLWLGRFTLILTTNTAGLHQDKIDAYSLRAKERCPKASKAYSSRRSASDERAAPSLIRQLATRARTKDGTNRSNGEIVQELTKREDRLLLLFSLCHEE